jgi:hypothetical protein
MPLSFEVPGEGRVALDLRHAVVAGWTGRDPAAIEHHIEELAAIGVPRPSQVPLYYRVAAQQATQAETIQVIGTNTSGEVEPVLFDTGEALYLTLGSDHTDRQLETHSVALSKQICAKPVGTGAWRFRDVAERIERIELRAFVRESESEPWALYQEGAIAAIRPLAELLAGAPGACGPDRLPAGSLMFCGTFPVVSGGVRPAPRMRLEMHDPVTGRSLSHAYRTEALPVIA